jgi:hypothetical protein
MGLFTGGSGRARGAQAKAAKEELKRFGASGAERISKGGATVENGHIIYSDGHIECTPSCRHNQED